MNAKFSDDIRKAVELRAYFIWEREGRPEGRQHQHWALAEAEILGGKPVKKASKAKVAAKPATKKTAPVIEVAKTANEDIKPKAPSNGPAKPKAKKVLKKAAPKKG